MMQGRGRGEQGLGRGGQGRGRGGQGCGRPCPARLLFSTPIVDRTPTQPLDAHMEGSPNTSPTFGTQTEEEEQNLSMDEGGHGSAQTPAGELHGTSEKLFVGLSEGEFEPHLPAFKDMKDIVHGYYKGIWTSIRYADDDAKETWFKEFEKKFYWDVSNVEMKRAFMTLAGKHIREVFKGHRRKKTIPFFLTKDHWDKIEDLRRTDPSLVRQAAANKRNRASQRAIDAGVYRGGSRKVAKWMKKIEKDTSKRPMYADVVKMLWTRDDGTWTGPRPATYVGNFVDMLSSQRQNDPQCAESADDENADKEPIDPVLEKRLWVQACDGPRNGRVFAMGEQGKALIRNGMISTPSTQGQSSQVYKETQLQPLREEMTEIRSTLVDLVHQQQQFQNTMLQHILKLQGATSNGCSTANPP